MSWYGICFGKVATAYMANENHLTHPKPKEQIHAKHAYAKR